MINAGLNPDYARFEEHTSENMVDDVGRAKSIFSVAQCVDEMSVSRTLREQRVVCDLQTVPDLFLQISAMSNGIPQLTAKESEYVIDGQNGKVIKDFTELSDAIGFYLESIANFNQAQIASYELGSQFTTDKLIASWKEVISR